MAQVDGSGPVVTGTDAVASVADPVRPVVLTWSALGVLALLGSVAVWLGSGRPGHPGLLLVTLVLILLGNLVEVELPLARRSIAFGLTETGLVISFVLLPPEAVVVPVALGMLLVEVLRRSPLERAAYNTGVTTAGAGAAAAVVAVSGFDPSDIVTAWGLGILVVALLVFGTISIVAAGTLLARLEGTAFQLAFRSIAAGGYLGLALAGSFGLAAAALLHTAPVAVPALVLPAIVAHASLAERVTRIRNELAEADRLERLLEGANDGIALLDGDGRIEIANPALSSLLGLPDHRVAGTRLPELLDTVGAVVAPSLDEVLDGSSSDVRHARVDVRVEDRVLLLGLTGLFDRLERRTGTVAIVQDVTAQHEAAMLQRELIARVSHELRTPLTSILGFVHLLRTDRHRLPEEDIDRYLDVVRRQGQRLERLVADLLWSSRIEQGRVQAQPTRLALTTAVEEALASLAEVLHSTVEIDVDAVEVVMDGDQLQQVLVNLLDNAESYGAPPVRIEAHRAGQQAVLVVSDAGRGIPPRFEGELFGRFSQASTGDRRTSTGLGLGLAICRSLVEANHGSISYARRGGRTCFEIRLPAGGPEVPGPRTSRP